MTVFKMKVQFLQNERLSNMVEMGQRRKCKFVIHYIYIYVWWMHFLLYNQMYLCKYDLSVTKMIQIPLVLSVYLNEN